MAKLTGPLNSVEARGKLGGLVYNTWRGISYVRTKVTPETKPPGLREEMMAYTIAAARRWATLTDSERATWYDFSLAHVSPDWTGNDLRLTGYHWYVRINVRTRWHIGLWQDTPPDHVSICGPIYPWSRYDEPLIEVFWTAPESLPDYYYIVELWITGPLSAGRSATIKDAKFFDFRALSEVYCPIPYPLPGTYSIFTRPMTHQGMVGQFEKTVVTVPQPE